MQKKKIGISILQDTPIYRYAVACVSKQDIQLVLTFETKARLRYIFSLR